MKSLEIFGTTFTLAVSPSNRATCPHCKKKIEKGAKRLEVSEPSSFNNNRVHYLCQKCATKFISKTVRELLELAYNVFGA